MSKKYIEKARAAVDLLVGGYYPPTPGMANAGDEIRAVIELCEHQTARVIELERDVDINQNCVNNMVYAIQCAVGHLEEWVPINTDDPQPAEDDPETWREKYQECQEHGWRYERKGYGESVWTYRSDWGFNDGQRANYRIAHSPIPEGMEYDRYDYPKKGEKYWNGLWMRVHIDQPIASKFHILRDKVEDER